MNSSKMRLAKSDHGRATALYRQIACAAIYSPPYTSKENAFIAKKKSKS